MRRSIGGGNAKMGGGNGGIIRSVTTRANVNSTLQEPFSSSNSTNSQKKNNARKSNSPNLLSLSSPPSISSSLNSSPFSHHNFSSSLPNWSYCEDSEWVSVDGSADFFDEFVIGAIPSVDEVQNAVSALQQAQFVRDIYGSDKDVEHHSMSPIAFASELDWTEPAMQYCGSKMLQPHGNNRVYDAFYLLQTDKSVQRMVTSLSSDKAVWDAVLNNEVVRGLKESFDSDDNYSIPGSDNGSDGSVATVDIMKWILYSTKEKATELYQTIINLVNHLFQPSETENEKTGEAVDPFAEKVRSSFLLTIVVMLIVVVSRVHKG